MSSEKELTKFGNLLNSLGIKQSQIFDVSQIIYPDSILTKNQISSLCNKKGNNFQMQTLEKLLYILMLLTGRRFTPNDIIDFEYISQDIFKKDGLIQLKKTELWQSKIKYRIN